LTACKSGAERPKSAKENGIDSCSEDIEIPTDKMG
jgi:hypothetical protein